MNASSQQLLRWLTLYAFLSGFLLIFLLVERFRQPAHIRELTVERINIVEKDGQLKMVISNQARQHPGMIEGKPIAPRDRPAGLVFFNDAGDECGGLIYDGNRQSASMTFSVDQYQNDQIMQLQYAEARSQRPATRHYGLRLWDRPDTITLWQLMHRLDSLKALPAKDAYDRGVADLKARHLLGEERLFVGRNDAGDVGLFIRDQQGRPRLQFYVDKRGNCRLEALDTTGRPVPFSSSVR